MTKRAGLEVIKKWEGLRTNAYVCPAGVATIGYGTTRIDGKPVRMGTSITKERAEQLAIADYDRFEAEVKKLIKVTVNENQLGALVSFAYNLGSQRLASSTLLRLLNKGDFTGASKEFDKWNKASGRVMKGLVDRRNDEEALFLKPVAAEKPKAEPKPKAAK